MQPARFHVPYQEVDQVTIGRFHSPRAGSKSLFAILFVAGGLALASNYYPELGGGQVTGPERDKYDSWIKCGFLEVAEPFKSRLAHCCDEVSNFRIYRHRTSPYPHWRNGNSIWVMPGTIPIAFTPHATENQITNCDFCMAVDHERMCQCIQQADTNPQKKAYLKSVFRHEMVHLFQYGTWSIWHLSPEAL